MTRHEDSGRTGQKFGPFRIGTLVGRGGMGEVYRGVHASTQVQVAVKFISKEGYGDPINRKRFLREIKACTTLQHPSVVRVLDWGEQDGDIWFAMDFVGGRTLADLLEQHPRLDLTRSLSIAGDLMSALVCMHSAGFVHRDIKPANIMITPEGRTVLMDFGLVKIAGDETFTVVGKVLGTPRYMAPEMIAGRVCDERGDLYQVAFVVHECVSGSQAFPASDYLRFLQGDLSPIPTPARQFVPAIPAALDTWLANALAPDPDRRYASASEMQGDLERVKAGEGIEPYGQRVSRSHTSLAVEQELTAIFGELTPIASDPWGAIVEAREGEAPAWIRVVPPRLLVRTDRDALMTDLHALTMLDAPSLLLPGRIVPVGSGLLLMMPAGPKRRLADQTDPLAPGQAASLVLDCIQALAPLHASGAGHGFLDGRSILIGGLGGLKIIDVEAHVIARHTDCLHAKDSSLRMSMLTAPEVLDGEVPSPAADLYSLGRLLVRLVTGRSSIGDDITMRLPAPLTDLVETVVRPLPERLSDPVAFAAALRPLAFAKQTVPSERRPTGKTPPLVRGVPTPRQARPTPAPARAASSGRGAVAALVLALAMIGTWVVWPRARRPGPVLTDPQGVHASVGVGDARLTFTSGEAYAAAVEYGSTDQSMVGVREIGPTRTHVLVLSGLSRDAHYLWRFVAPDGRRGPNHSFVTGTIAVTPTQDDHRVTSIRIAFRTSIPVRAVVLRAGSRGGAGAAGAVPGAGGAGAATGTSGAGGAGAVVAGPEASALTEHSFDLPSSPPGSGADVDICDIDAAGRPMVLRHWLIASLGDRLAKARQTITPEWVSGVVAALRENKRRHVVAAMNLHLVEDAVASRQACIGQVVEVARPALDSPDLDLDVKARLYDLLTLLSKLDAGCQALDVHYATGATTERPESFRLTTTPMLAVPDEKIRVSFPSPDRAFIPFSTPKVEAVEEIFTSTHGKRSDHASFDVASPDSIKAASIYLPVRYLDEGSFKDNTFDLTLNDRLRLLFRYEHADFQARGDPHLPMPGLHHSFDPRFLKAKGNTVKLQVTPIPGIGYTMGMTTIPYLEVWLDRR